MIQNVHHTRQEMGAAAPSNVSFTFFAIKKFKVPLIGQYLIHYEDNQRHEEGEAVEPEKPGDLTDLDKQEVWFERFDTYCSNIQGATKFPIKYVYWEQEVPDLQDLAGSWDNHDDLLIACTLLQGNWFNADNKRIYDELKALCLGKSSTPVAWTFIKTFDRQRDGRSAPYLL